MVIRPAEILTGKGSPGPFKEVGPTTLVVCVTGGPDVTFSNITLVMDGPAIGHFGTQPNHGIVRFTHTDNGEEHNDHH